MRQLSSVLRILVLTIAASGFVFVNVQAGPLRDRDRFNVKADGFYMKGRCFKSGKSSFLSSGGAKLFGGIGWKDVGCVVKHRKGKRRPRKEKADAYIHMTIYVEGEGGQPVPALTSAKLCNNAKKCKVGVNQSRKEIVGGRIKVGDSIQPGKPITAMRFGKLDKIGGRAAVIGIRGCIMSAKDGKDRMTTTIHVELGRTEPEHNWMRDSRCPLKGKRPEALLRIHDGQ